MNPIQRWWPLIFRGSLYFGIPFLLLFGEKLAPFAEKDQWPSTIKLVSWCISATAAGLVALRAYMDSSAKTIGDQIKAERTNNPGSLDGGSPTIAGDSTMKKTVTAAAIVMVVLAFALTGRAQETNPPPPSAMDTNGVISGPVWQVVDFLATGSNWMVAPYGIATLGDHGQFGGGIGVGYKISEFVVPTLRLDYLDSSIWMPSGNLQLQVPMTVMGKLTLIPFVFTGLATPISGRGTDNGSAVGIFGIGGAIRIPKLDHWDIVFDIEKWTNFDGDQLRFGIVYKF